MKLIVSSILLAIFLVTGCAIAQASRPLDSAAPESLTAASSVDQILDALEFRGRDLRMLSADVRMATSDPTLGDETVQSGKFWLDNGNGSPRVHIIFDRKEIGQRAIEQKIEYVLDNGKLIDRNYEKRQQATHIVLRPGEKMDLLKLGEGPFPLPIGQKRDAVHEQFDVKKIDAGKDDPADTVHVQLIPKPQTSLSRRFQSIDVWVNLRDQLPQRIRTLDLNGAEEKTTDLTNVKVNPPLTDADFALPRVDEKQWNFTEDQFQNAAPDKR